MAGGKKRPSGPAASGAKTAITLILIVAVIFGWAKVNNIDSFESAYKYFKSWADYTRDCGAETLEWKCGNEGGDGGSGTPGGGEETPGGSDSAGGGTDAADGTPGGTTPGSSTREALEAKLASVTVAPTKKDAPYSAADWKRWTGSPCNTRENVLIAQGVNVVTDPKTCAPVSGSWTEPYANTTVTEAGKLDIDHVVPTSYAERNGGAGFTKDVKTAFANDTEGLMISLAKENRAKGDRGPGSYLPPNEAFRCDYISKFLHMVTKYGLTMPEEDVTAAKAVIYSNCS